MRKFLFCLLYALATSAAYAAEEDNLPHTSLFFTPQQIIEAERLADKQLPVGQGDIRLGAVMYYGPQDWTLWLQGELWTPETKRDDLRILSVNANEVRLSWRNAADATEHEMTLTPNQSYQLATGKIVTAP